MTLPVDPRIHNLFAGEFREFLENLESGIIVLSDSAPSSADDTGTAGTIVRDDDFIYICVATDTWKRIAIATWV